MLFQLRALGFCWDGQSKQGFCWNGQSETGFVELVNEKQSAVRFVFFQRMWRVFWTLGSRQAGLPSRGVRYQGTASLIQYSFLCLIVALYLASYESEGPENNIEKDRWKSLRWVSVLLVQVWRQCQCPLRKAMYVPLWVGPAYLVKLAES